MREKEIFSGAVSLFVEACFSPAKSWKKTKKQEANDGELIHTSKPDLDNVLKIALDALSGIVFDDDQQVVEVIATKKYGPESYLYVRVNAVE